MSKYISSECHDCEDYDSLYGCLHHDCQTYVDHWNSINTDLLMEMQAEQGGIDDQI